MGDEHSKVSRIDDDDDDSYKKRKNSSEIPLGGIIALFAVGAAVGVGALKIFQILNEKEKPYASYSGDELRLSARATNDSFPKSRFAYPDHWSITKFEENEDHFEIIECPRGSSEFQKVHNLMSASMPNVNIKSVKRIENKMIFEFYIMKKVQMERKNCANERHLFHGTLPTSAKSICYQGFDIRLCGERTGSRYGKGMYFASNAKFSDDYCEASSQTKQMFLASALVGNFVNGHSQYKRPPPIQNKFDLYDSCVDNVRNPVIFVIFDSSQVYPEYLIDYT